MPQSLLRLYRHQASLSAAHEKTQRLQLGQLTFSQAEQDRLAQYEQLYQQMKLVHQQTQFDYGNVAQQLDAFVAVLDQAIQYQDSLVL